MRSSRLLAIIAALILLSIPVVANSHIVIVNMNAPNVGFNDPTPAVPVGGNPGTTVGQQRLNAFQKAADIWGGLLDSKVTIYIQASFVPLACTATSATLGSAGTIQVFANFPNAPELNTWYHVALANRLAGDDLAPGATGTSADDIIARFNSDLGKPTCLAGTGWYYGFDLNHGNDIDLVTVLLHEFAHGLGFSTFVNKSTGAFLAGLPDVYLERMYDNTLGTTFDLMASNAQRAGATIDTRNVVWIGPMVTEAVPSFLALGTPLLTVNSPASVAGIYQVGPASFGPPLAEPGISGNIVVALDDANPTGPTTTDACTAITNPAAVAGNIALVDRGACTFAVKVKNAQNAGAIAVIVADNAAGSPPAGMSGSDPTIVIPSVRITQADGNTIKAALAGGPVNATLGVNMNVRAGADPTGHALLYTPNPVIGGSSLSHWDTIAFPNLLMEPNINSDLTHNVDLTLPLFRDIGWYPDQDLDGVPDDLDQCPNTDLTIPSVVVGTCDSGVPNTFFSSGAYAGCTISQLVQRCYADASNHGASQSCVADVIGGLKNAGTITGAQQGAITSCAARTK